MNTEFSMSHRVNLGNMHINLSGYIDELATEKLLTTIKEVHVGAGRIFIDARNITSLSPKASENFKNSFNNLSINNNNLYIKGKEGIELIPEGGRLIMFNEKKEKEHKGHSCSGSGGCNCKVPCKVCKCAEKRKEKAKQAAV